MNRKTYWGIAALVIILIAAGGFMYWQWSSVQQLKEELAQDNKMLEERDKPVAENKPPPAREGFKMVPHGDHWHEVPLDAPDTWQGETHEPSAQPVQTPKTYDGPLTYDQELFETNPVKALSLEMEARGLWGAGYIPPFPPDDLEAQELARYEYIVAFMPNAEDKVVLDAVNKSIELRRHFDEKYGFFSARACDLRRLTWPNDENPSPDWEILVNSPNYPSEYFNGGELR
ncbi:MAG: hypothetical protein OXI67_09855 [Candidatus Poribacteria bacterium]|nr:hypothetical protein [Candidatus Poribacteria bacterium]